MASQHDLLFEPAPPDPLATPEAPRAPAPEAPLPERMRPTCIDEMVGQDHLLGAGRILRSLIDDGRPVSLILWGPPGSGKTTLARLLAGAFRVRFVALSAVLSGVKELRAVAEEASLHARSGRPTIVFVDEIHRFNKAQQDALLPHVERGVLTLIGATTENPSFEVISPLLSRLRVLRLEPLDDAALTTLVERALADPVRGLGGENLRLEPEARDRIVARGRGDARATLGILEVATRLARTAGRDTIDAAGVDEAAQERWIRHDRSGDQHYDVVSAFIKSLRGSDPDAALYWLARMVEAGEDPLFIARRMVIFASEDVGNADPGALSLAIAVKDAVQFVGWPEARIALAQGATHLACAAKSNASYAALERALTEVRASGALEVPLHLRNAPTALSRSMGHGAGYLYPHDHPGHHVAQNHLPDELAGRHFFEPGDQGAEIEQSVRLREWRARQSAGPSTPVANRRGTSVR